MPSRVPGEQVLHRLGHDVRGRVPDHGQPVGRRAGDRLDLDVVLGHPIQVVQHAVGVAHHDRAGRAAERDPG